MGHRHWSVPSSPSVPTSTCTASSTRSSSRPATSPAPSAASSGCWASTARPSTTSSTGSPTTRSRRWATCRWARAAWTTPIRSACAGVGDHPEVFGFPADHPTDESLLSMPVRIGDTIFGNLYLTRKSGGGIFTNGDEARVDALARVAGLMVRNARRYAVSERRREWVEASAEIAESLHDVTRIDETLDLIVGGARRVSRAALVAVVRRTEGGFEVPASSGSPTATLPVLLDLFTDEIDVVRDSGELITCRYDSDGTAVIVPLTAQLSDQGVMLAILDRGRGRLRDEDRDLISSFVAHASLALDRAQAIVDRHELVLVDDRDRIARDLHDLVIQRLFATGLQLQGARHLVPGERPGPDRHRGHGARPGDPRHPVHDLRAPARQRLDASCRPEQPDPRVRRHPRLHAADPRDRRPRLARQPAARRPDAGRHPRGALELRAARRGQGLPGRGRGQQRLAAAPRHRQRPRGQPRRSARAGCATCVAAPSSSVAR